VWSRNVADEPDTNKKIKAEPKEARYVWR
jgi:hypothetical protein